MKIRKLLIFVVFAIAIVLSGCGSGSTPEKLWDKYVKAMNTKDIEAVAEVYYPKGSSGYLRFIEENVPEDYFDFNKIATKTFKPLVENERYYKAEITVQVDDFENIFDVYFIRDVNSPWRFISEVDATDYDITKLGNKPDSGYFNNIILNDGSFDYKYIYGTTPGEVSGNDYVKIVHPNKNSKSIVIPDEIDGVPVKQIGDFAFFDYFRIFTVTFSRSKLEEIVLPNQLELIDSYAFYQTKNLKEINLPSTLKEVKNYAFASSGLEKLTINVDDAEAYAKLASKTGVDSMTIRGDRVVFLGDTPAPQYSIAGGTRPAVTWETSDETIATINPAGRLTMLKAGVIEITARVDDEYYTKATVEIKEASEKTQTSTIPAAPFAGYKFDIKNTFFVGEEFTTNMSLATNWSTSNASVAKVEGNKVVFVGVGTVKITATAQDNASVKAEATVTVKAANEKSVQTVYSYETFNFTGARDMFVGDYIKLVAEGFNESEIEWTTSNAAVATVGRYNGVVTGISAGSVEIRGTRIDDPNISCTVTIQISAPVKGVSFAENALDRLNNIKEIYINSINPYSIEIKGTLKLPATVKIYVPAQNIDTYKKAWATFANNIYPME